MPFKKGQSGNPSGRPKAFVEVIELARSKTVENLKRIEVLATSAVDEGVQLRAAIALHEIAWGKPMQPIEASGKDGGPLVIKWQDAATGSAEKPKQ